MKKHSKACEKLGPYATNAEVYKVCPLCRARLISEGYKPKLSNPARKQSSYKKQILSIAHYAVKNRGNVRMAVAYLKGEWTRAKKEHRYIAAFIYKQAAHQVLKWYKEAKKRSLKNPMDWKKDYRYGVRQVSKNSSAWPAWAVVNAEDNIIGIFKKKSAAIKAAKAWSPRGHLLDRPWYERK